MSTLLRVPREILGIIFASCDKFQQVTALASTCKLLHSIWESNAPRIIWSVGQSDIFLFNEVLILIRATALVIKHLQDAQLPPHPLPFALLSGDTVKPTLAELHSVLDVEHLVRCMRWRMCGQGDSANHQLGTQREKKLCDDCIVRGQSVHRAFYRLFLIAAALSGLFHEPLLSKDKDANRPPDFLVQYKREIEAMEGAEGSDDWETEQVLSTSDIGYLMEFPVYRLQDFDAYDGALGQLAEFLVDISWSHARRQSASTWTCTLGPKEHAKLRGSCRKGAQCPRWTTGFLSRFGPYSDIAKAATLFTEMTHLLAAWAWMDGNQFFPSMYGDNNVASRLRTSSTSREVTLIDPQSLVPIKWFMPASATEAMDLGVIYETAKFNPDPSSKSPSGYIGPLDSILEIMWSESGQPNHYTHECPVACYSLQFFEYVFRKYLGIRFADEAFLHNPKYSPFKQWIGLLNVFEDPWVVMHESDPQGTFSHVDSPRGQAYFSPELFS
ncbi:hypothetical protein BJX63DRAFT_434574 [Aspergillus granulosus]|uniref:F-box domain-containing protein n=1 Tax=Aspergillus granulosus TaxID=176169 RepID=A0ABR4H3Z3_9EURO